MARACATLPLLPSIYELEAFHRAVTQRLPVGVSQTLCHQRHRASLSCVRAPSTRLICTGASTRRTSASSVSGTGPAAQQVFDQLSTVGIDLPDVFVVLEKEGVEKFEASWSELLDATASQLDAAK